MPTASLRLPKTTVPVISDRLRCVTGPFGAVQFVAAWQRVLLDLQARNFTTTGDPAEDHASAVISLADAKHLLVELAAAVAQAESLPPPAVAPAWSDETLRRVALVSPARRHPNRQRTRVST